MDNKVLFYSLFHGLVVAIDWNTKQTWNNTQNTAGFKIKQLSLYSKVTAYTMDGISSSQWPKNYLIYYRFWRNKEIIYDRSNILAYKDKDKDQVTFIDPTVGKIHCYRNSKNSDIEYKKRKKENSHKTYIYIHMMSHMGYTSQGHRKLGP